MEYHHIYFLLPDLSAGGAERVTITIARLLHKEGFEVEFINLGHPNGEMKSWIEPEFKMVSFGYNRVLVAIPKLYQFMKSHPESVYFSSREHVSIVGMIASKIARRQMVVRIPNMPRNVLVSGLIGLKLRIIKHLNQYLLKTVKKVIAQNDEMRLQLLEYYKLPSNKVVTINNPVDKDYVIASAENCPNPFQKKETNFLSVCNVAFSKGIDVLEQSWKKVKEAIPNAHMYIVGRTNSNYAQEMIERAKGLPDFTFLGFQGNPYPFLKYCDVFVLPSRMEGFPNVVLEAICFNKPIACTTCVEVLKKLIQLGSNGYYCNVEDADALAECMIRASRLTGILQEYQLFDKKKLLYVFS